MSPKALITKAQVTIWHLLAQMDTTGKLVAGLGFEPRQAESESAVLPLHNPAGEKKWLIHHLSGEGC